MASKSITILISSAGRRVELMKLLREAAQWHGRTARIIATDVNPELSPACHLADHALRVSAATDPAFIDETVDVVRRWDVDLVVPTIDPELEPLANTRRRFSEMGARVAVSNPDAVRACRDKRLTMGRLGDAGIPIPISYDASDYNDADIRRADVWLSKPAMGSSSRGVQPFDPSADEPFFSEPTLLQEVVRGVEYTTNVYVGADGTVQSVVPHMRLKTRGGEVEKAQTVSDGELRKIAGGIVAAIPGLRGAFCFQTIHDRDRGHLVIEVNARFGGGYPLAHAAGAPFVRWLIEETLGMAPSFDHVWREGVTMLRYDDSVFVDSE